jgi:glucose uptake protein GlcU
VDSKFGQARPSTRNIYVAYPPPGYVPYKLVWPRWSFAYPGANFANASVAIFLLYCAATRGRPWVRGAMVLPSLCGGLCWGVACACWFVTNERLSLVVAMPVVTIGPGVLTMLIGAVAFKEVQGARNVALMAASVVMYTGA